MNYREIGYWHNILFLVIDRIRYKSSYRDFKQARKMLRSVRFIQNEYLEISYKYNNKAFFNKEKIVDDSYRPNIYWKYLSKGVIELRMKFNCKVSQLDYEKLIEEIRTSETFLVTGVRFEKGFCYVKLIFDEAIADEVYNQDFKFVNLGHSIGQVLEWDYNKYPHALICGDTGTGKTTLMKYLINGFLLHGALIDVLDGKEIDYFKYKNSFNKYKSTSSINNLSIVADFKNEMESRLDLMRNSEVEHYTEIGLTPRVLLIDEQPSFYSSLDKKGKAIFDEMLGDIVRRGRAIGFFLIIGMQRADSIYLETSSRDNFNVRIGLGSPSDTSKRMLFDTADVPSFGMGQGNCKIGNEIISFTIPFVKDVHQVIQKPLL